jgi:hypothetical protein
VVLPSSIGLNSKQLKNQMSDDGLNLKVKMFHPPSWTKTIFHKKACYNEGLSKEFTGYLINAEQAELEKLAKLTGSDSRDKIGTFMKRPIVCELEIRYTIPIHHQETSTTTYIFVLRSVRSKDHFIQKEKPKMAHVFKNEDDDDSVSSTESGDKKRRRLH